MSRIKSRNTKPELLVRKFLFKNGFRFRLHVKNLPGTPDIVLKKHKTAIYIHGCFWHGHSHCKYYVIPETNKQWWLAKIGQNIQRDNENIERLKEMNWKVIIIWECELKKNSREVTFSNLIKSLS
jgi:DNA mismatch endonuclease (patch repair protein)